MSKLCVNTCALKKMVDDFITCLVTVIILGSFGTSLSYGTGWLLNRYIDYNDGWIGVFERIGFGFVALFLVGSVLLVVGGSIYVGYKEIAQDMKNWYRDAERRCEQENMRKK